MKYKKAVIKNLVGIFGLILVLSILPLASAGVGLKWNEESVIIEEGEEACLTYSVYNPWPKETYAKIGVSDNLKEMLIMQESEEKLVPADTASTNAIPVKFCFKVPRVYSRDCWIGDSFICKQECKEEQKVYEGDVVVSSVPPTAAMGGSGGSSTSMSVSAPLRLRVTCTPYARDYSLIYIAVGLISLVIVIILLKKRSNEKKKKKR